MLDFYIINDDEPKPNYPEQSGLRFAGSLDEKTFSNLKAKNLIGDQFDYYADFRWGTTVIMQMRQHIMQKRMSYDPDVTKIKTLFEIAEKYGSGLMAYSD